MWACWYAPLRRQPLRYLWRRLYDLRFGRRRPIADASKRAHGRGLVIVDEKVDGYTSITQGTIGLQIGGQKYAQFIFFRDDTALGHFRRGNFEFGAQASAVAITAGASADAAYDSGVAIFTHAAGGLMLEGTVGGQRFTYTPKEK